MDRYFDQLDDRWRELEDLHKQAVAILQKRGHWDRFPETPTSVILEKHPGRRFCRALEQAHTEFRSLTKQVLPQLFRMKNWKERPMLTRSVPWKVRWQVWLCRQKPDNPVDITQYLSVGWVRLTQEHNHCM